MNERLTRLEEKIAYLERHVTEQDKAMLEMSDAIGGLRRELKTLRDRTVSAEPGAAEPDSLMSERPPHY